MKPLNRDNLALALRQAILEEYETIQACADDIGWDVNDLRRVYSMKRAMASNKKGVGNIVQLMRVFRFLKKHEIVFEIRRRK